jgi:pyruvate/2-oxoglutarate dehydrogenase complex dihydrolipoamide acyltransferase (E2) component
MQTKKLLYAAVGAPIAVAKTAQARVEEIRVKLSEGAGSLTKDLEAQLDEWAKEGEELMGRIGDSKAVDELTERMDLDQVQEQVTRLRDQLEDLLDTWRSNFRPGVKNGHPVEIPVEDAAAAASASPTTRATSPKAATPEKPTAEKPPAEKPTAEKPAARKAAAEKGTTRKAPAKKPATGKPDTPAS